MNRQHTPTLGVIRAAYLIDGKGGEPLPDQAIVVQDGWIRDIMPWGDESIASLNQVTEVVDIEDATLLPGLIDMHAHLTLDAEEIPTDVLSQSNETILLRAVGNAQAAIRVGVTTVCDCGAQNHLIFALREAIKAGIIKGPRMVASGNMITTTGGHGHFSATEADGVEEVRQAVVEQVEAGADFIKIMVTGGGGSPGSQYGLEEVQAVTDEARRLGKRIVAHCHGTAGIRNAVEAGVTRIEHCTFLEQDGSVFNSDIAEAIVQKGIYICPTNAVDYRKLQMCGNSAERTEQLALREQLITTWRELLRHGAEFVAGSDAGIPQVFCDDYALIMELMVGELGMSPMQAILTGTKVAAEGLGMEDEIGTLEVGKRADIIAVSDNPLEDISALGKVCLVMLGGEVIRNGR